MPSKMARAMPLRASASSIAAGSVKVFRKHLELLIVHKVMCGGEPERSLQLACGARMSEWVFIRIKH